jgi:hypothetical protein
LFIWYFAHIYLVPLPVFPQIKSESKKEDENDSEFQIDIDDQNDSEYQIDIDDQNDGFREDEDDSDIQDGDDSDFKYENFGIFHCFIFHWLYRY